jgi:predicted DNA binding CopG/RHH family protein
MEKENKKVIINIRIDTELIEQYKKHCSDNGYSLSKRLRILIKKDLENGIRL